MQKILSERQAAVDRSLEDAESAQKRAEEAEAAYNAKLVNAQEESAEIVRRATRKAQQRSDEIIAGAKADAASIRQHNEEEIAREKRRAQIELRSEVAGLAVSVAEKVVEREINPADHARLIDEFIESVGDAE